MSEFVLTNPLLARRCKPCEKCGSRPHPVDVIPQYGGGWVVWCENCQDKGPLRREAERAISAWNLNPRPSKELP